MPTIDLNGYSYHLQELAFFSWYYNADGVASYGTGGEFSGTAHSRDHRRPVLRAAPTNAQGLL